MPDPDPGTAHRQWFVVVRLLGDRGTGGSKLELMDGIVYIGGVPLDEWIVRYQALVADPTPS